MADPVLVDDSDPSVKYTGGPWFRAGGPNEQSGTTHGTQGAGAQATLIFNGASAKTP